MVAKSGGSVDVKTAAGGNESGLSGGGGRDLMFDGC
jgi:hypothetical protein